MMREEKREAKRKEKEEKFKEAIEKKRRDYLPEQGERRGPLI